MAVVNQTLDLPQNGKWEITFAVTLNGQPVDITGWTAHMQIRAKKTSAVVLAEYTTDPGGYITISGVAGQVLVDVPGDITLNYGFGSGVYDLYATDTGGNRRRIAEGNINVNDTVTR